jgi:N-acetylhexosamine 1-kinase
MTRDFEPTHENAPQLEKARKIAMQFDLQSPLEISDFQEKGNINQQAYLITPGQPEKRTQYILQLLNPDVFTKPDAVMNGMIACIQAQQTALAEGIPGEDEWETIRLIPTRDGANYLVQPGPSGTECWRVMARILGTVAFRRLNEIDDWSTRMRVAEEAGRGLALFQNLTATMDVSGFTCPLPGYRETDLYYDQLLSILAGHRSLMQAEACLPADPEVRESTAQHYLVHIDAAEYRRRIEDPQLRPYIDLCLEQQPFAVQLIRKLKSGELKKVVVHGDTKLENFLFSSRTGRVKALVDLDTIMPHTWLSDWGDMVRSLVNLAGEREADPAKIEVDLEVLRSLARGFLGTARHVDSGEVELMADAAQIMALELGVRFLADYLRGDSYFQLKPGEPKDLNKTRAAVQFILFERLRSKAEAARAIIQTYYRG